METILERKSIPYNSRNPQEFVTQGNRRVNYGLESLSNRLSQLWVLVPNEYKQINSSNLFKSNLRKWICTNCPYRLYKRFVQILGFL